jgi:hypothetical protein
MVMVWEFTEIFTMGIYTMVTPVVESAQDANLNIFLIRTSTFFLPLTSVLL